MLQVDTWCPLGGWIRTVWTVVLSLSATFIWPLFIYLLFWDALVLHAGSWLQHLTTKPVAYQQIEVIYALCWWATVPYSVCLLVILYLRELQRRNNKNITLASGSDLSLKFCSTRRVLLGRVWKAWVWARFGSQQGCTSDHWQELYVFRQELLVVPKLKTKGDRAFTLEQPPAN